MAPPAFPVRLAIVPAAPVDADGAGHALYPGAAGGWSVWAACGDCGGYGIGLGVDERERWDHAAERASAFLLRVHEEGCLGCRSRQRRARGFPPVDELQLWWDTLSGDWVLPYPVGRGGGGVALPLGVRDFWAAHEARAAARALLGSGALPLRIAGPGREIDRDLPTAWCDRDLGTWSLWCPCGECGGLELPLTPDGGRRAAPDACDEALACLELVAEEGCPGCCRLRARRAIDAGDDTPRVWFEPALGGWVLWQGLPGSGEGLTLPLGHRRFDADRATVHRAAADLLFSDPHPGA